MNEEEINKEAEDAFRFFHSVIVAREAIIEELERRWKESPINVTVPTRTDRFSKPQKNYFCGSGSMPCPICKIGNLQYSRAAYNGHVHAACSTSGCVRWTE